MIAIVDYGMGNLASVSKALDSLGARAKVTSKPEDIRRAAAIIFPGVGAFGEAMRELKRRRLVGPILEAIEEERPFLGLCLGLQLLFASSEEAPGVRGLGVLPGRVRRLPRAKNLKVPHMGWNQIEKIADFGLRTSDLRTSIRNRQSTIRNSLLAGIPNGAFMYFVHSFYADPKEKNVVAAVTSYGRRFPAVLANGRNLWATQFHPEKSQKWGLKILNNFLKVVGSC